MFQYNQLISRNFTNIALKKAVAKGSVLFPDTCLYPPFSSAPQGVKCDNILFAVPPHLTAYTSFLCYSGEVHQAVLTLVDFILL